MTPHLTGISKRYALEVSDRLVSGGMKDPLANKNVIYLCRDAVVSMGYTGFAYGLSESNENTPTDEWLAEVLWGEPIPRGRDGVRPAWMCSRDNARFLDIRQSAELLRNKKEKRARGVFAGDQSTEVCVRIRRHRQARSRRRIHWAGCDGRRGSPQKAYRPLLWMRKKKVDEFVKGVWRITRLISSPPINLTIPLQVLNGTQIVVFGN
jgi:hypothetical protein